MQLKKATELQKKLKILTAFPLKSLTFQQRLLTQPLFH